ncbi:unnamed protein product [Caenorhabditis auriculariae]|uniref:Uncharacterized protein n=1 Tax=Caenorhabditis auriculariae TaxID=2777116 RepID=A0A8S1HBS0_9PELO|nr:unnamed protein product [Caenorhabditis auriculariae]
MNAGLLWQSFIQQLEKIDFEGKIRLLRRYPRRRLALIAALVIFLFYVLSRSSSSTTPSQNHQCVLDQIKYWDAEIEDYNAGVDSYSVNFVGNGHFGVDSNGYLRFASNNSRVLDVETDFVPGVSSVIENQEEIGTAHLTDFFNGISRKIQCTVVDGECACVIVSFYAHRTRPNVLVQDIKVVNPTKSTIRLRAERPAVSSQWKQSKSGDAVVSMRTFNTPSFNVSVAVKREETLRFICVVAQKESKLEQTDLSSEVIEKFSTVRSLTTLDSEHKDGWKKLHSTFFSLVPSKAPDAINGDRVNATKYIILSHTKALTLEVGVPQETVKILELSARRNELCYSGHSTLLYPSRLWQDWSTPDDLNTIAGLWLLTLEKRGCSNVLKTGAVGVAQAFVQSLAAASFHDSHLEIGLDAGDLHREMSFGGIPIGSATGTVGNVAVYIKINEENRPYFLVSSTAQLYACDAGCLDVPFTLGTTAIKIPVKVTKPITSLLYIATNRKHLEQLKSAIHVSEVGAAPAHEEDLLELHRSGTGGGLPTSFWVMLVLVLIVFHLFLAKLLWSEWRKGDMTPYNPYLRSRYSYVRPH